MKDNIPSNFENDLRVEDAATQYAQNNNRYYNLGGNDFQAITDAFKAGSNFKLPTPKNLDEAAEAHAKYIWQYSHKGDPVELKIRTGQSKQDFKTGGLSDAAKELWKEYWFNQFLSQQKEPVQGLDETYNMLIEVRKQVLWMWNNLHLPHTPDHHNIPANTLDVLDEIISEWQSQQPKEEEAKVKCEYCENGEGILNHPDRPCAMCDGYGYTIRQPKEGVSVPTGGLRWVKAVKSTPEHNKIIVFKRHADNPEVGYYDKGFKKFYSISHINNSNRIHDVDNIEWLEEAQPLSVPTDEGKANIIANIIWQYDGEVKKIPHHDNEAYQKAHTEILAAIYDKNFSTEIPKHPVPVEGGGGILNVSI